jgi:hypothetical protein
LYGSTGRERKIINDSLSGADNRIANENNKRITNSTFFNLPGIINPDFNEQNRIWLVLA